MTFKAISGNAPVYIQELIGPYIPTRTLRSIIEPTTLPTPRVITKNYCDRTFSMAAPTNWNKLPTEIRKATEYEQLQKN